MEKQETTFALFFTNRTFMPGELILEARKEMAESLEKAGYKYIMMDESATRFGGIETRDEGRLYHDWLASHKGEYDGVILCMPIFADENGAAEALKDADAPILLQAYPDEIGKMDFAHRRDAFCGKFSVSDTFTQYGIHFTMLEPHVVHPSSEKWQENLHEFAAICRVVKGMKRFSLGCIGARTTAFKTTRFDEIALEKLGITVESIDLSDLVFKVQNLKDDDDKVIAKKAALNAYSDFSNVPEFNFSNLAKISVVIDDYIETYHLSAITLRCWTELQTILRVAPCVLLGELNNRGIPASCEIDLCSAITMRALSLATGVPAACVDWNNNYGEEEDKAILFHCGPIATSLMTDKGCVTAHKMFEKTDPGSGWGCCEGRIAAFPATYSNCQTKDGKLIVYTMEGRQTDDPIEPSYFGCAGVTEIPALQRKLVKLGKNGFKHHTTFSKGNVKAALDEAFSNYLGYTVVDID